MGKESKIVRILNEMFLMEGVDYSSLFKETYLADVLSRASISNTLDKCLVSESIEVPYLHHYIEDILNGKSVSYGDKLETLTFSIDRISQFGFTKIESYPYEYLCFIQAMDFARLDASIRKQFKHANQKWIQAMAVQLCKMGFNDFENVNFEPYNSDFFLYANSLFCLVRDGKQLNDLRATIAKNYIPYDLPNSYKEVLHATAIMGELLEVKYKDIFQRLLKDFINDKPHLKIFDKGVHPSICESNLNSIIYSLVKRAGLEKEVNEELNLIKFKINSSAVINGESVAQIGYLDCFRFYLAYLMKNKKSTKSAIRLCNAIYTNSGDDFATINFKKTNSLIAQMIGFEQCGGDFGEILDLFQKFGVSYKPKIFISKLDDIKELFDLKVLKLDVAHIAELLNKKGYPLHLVRNPVLKLLGLASQLKDIDFQNLIEDISESDGVIDYMKLENQESKLFKEFVKQKNYTL